jgi:hypothetical protein
MAQLLLEGRPSPQLVNAVVKALTVEKAAKELVQISASLPLPPSSPPAPPSYSAAICLFLHILSLFFMVNNFKTNIYATSFSDFRTDLLPLILASREQPSVRRACASRPTPGAVVLDFCLSLYCIAFLICFRRAGR